MSVSLLAPLLALVGVAVGTPSASAAVTTCAAANITVTPLHDSIFYIDLSPSPPTNPKLVGQYIGYKITNNRGTALNSAWVTIDGLTASTSGGVLSLGSGETGKDQLKDLANLGSDVSYFYLTATAATTTVQGHTVHVYDRRPDLTGATEICSSAQTITAVVNTTDAAANKVTTSVATSNPPGIGATMTMTVTGNTGTLGQGDVADPYVFQTSPATYLDWPAGAFRLEKVEADIDITNNTPTVPAPANFDFLRYTMNSAASKARDYTLIFTFKVIGVTSTATAQSPIQIIASGTQNKHTDVGNYGTIAAITPATNKTTLAKSATPTTLATTGGTVSYTVTITNADTVQAISLDDIADTLPAGATYVAGSAKFKGVAIADPTTSGTTRTWIGPFAVAASSSATLTYQATIPAIRGSYANSVIAHTGATVIDTTLVTTDSVPATVTVTVPNTPPVAVSDSYIVTTGSTLTVAAAGVLANDTDANNDTLTAAFKTNPANGSLTINANGSFTYTPTSGYTGADSFTYTVSDGNGGSATGTVNITVRARAVANTDSASLYAGNTTTISVLTNDTVDPAYTKTVSAVATPAHGAAVINSGTTITYTPAAGYTGTDTFTYTLSDGNGSTATGTVNITVWARPVATTDAASLYAGTSRTVSVLTNDTVDPAFTKSVTAVGAAAHGTVSLVGGVVTYTPTAAYTGTDTFTYTLSDSNGSTTTGTVNLTVLANPVAAADVKTTYTGDATVVPVLGNDTVDAAFTKSVSAVGAAAHGTVTLVGGVVTYTATNGYTGTDTFTYTLSDGNGGTATGTVTMTVRAKPVASTDSATLRTGTSSTISVLTNDSVDAAYTKSVSAVGTAAHGTVTINGGTTITYSSTGGYTGTDTFTYTLSDGNGGTATGTVNLTITAAPVAVNDSATLYADATATISVLANDSVDPSFTSSVSAVGPAAHGTVVINGNGTVTYTPAAGYTGADSFTYTLSDGNGGTATATVTLTVRARPSAGPDAAAGYTGDAIAVPVLGNDTVDATYTKSVSAVGTSAHGTVTLVGGAITYTSAAGYTGTDTFTYTLSDGNGGTATGTVTMTIWAKPAAADDSASLYAGSSSTISVLANDTAQAGFTTSVTGVGTAAHGTAVVNLDGTVTYTPAAGYTGPDSFTYTMSDGTTTSTATVNVTVWARPVAVDDSGAGYAGDAITVNVLANDTVDPAFTKSVLLFSTAGHGTVVASAGGLTYTPADGYTGTDSYTYILSDGNGATAGATVNLTVRARPVAGADTAAGYSGDAVVVGVLGNDTVDAAFTKSVAAVGTAAHGTVTLVDRVITYTSAAGYSGTDTFTYTLSDGNGATATGTVTVTVWPLPLAVDDTASLYAGTDTTISVLTNDTVATGLSKAVSGVGTPAHGTAVVNLDGTITYTPAAGYAGPDSFTYDLSDGTKSATATVSITVRAQPVATDDSGSGYVGDPITVAVLANDTVDPALTPAVVGTGTATHGSVAINVGGTVTYTPNAGYTGTDTFTYTLGDGNGGTATATVTIVVLARPVATDDSATLYAGSSVGITVLDNDTVDPAFTASVSGVGNPGHGTASVNLDGSITYTPAVGYTGPDSFSYTLADGNGATATGTVTITVMSRPVATDDSATTDLNTAVTVTVLANDTVDASASKSVTAVGAASHGSVVINGNGTVTYTPTAGYSGPDSFGYTLFDGTYTDDGLVSITVRPAAPVATNDAKTTAYGVTLSVPAPGVLANDTGTGLTATLLSAPAVASGTVVLQSNGAYVFTPAVGFAGKTTFTYTITDSFGRTATATVTITVSMPAAPSACGTGWQYNGTAAKRNACDIFLTPATQVVAGTAFFPTAQPTAKIASVTFDATMGTGTGADGIAMVFADPTAGATPTSLGGPGGRLGIGGIASASVNLDTFQNAGDPSSNFVGLCTMAGTAAAQFRCPTTGTPATGLRGNTLTTHHVVINVSLYFAQPYVSSVTIDGATVVTGNLSLPRSALVGFASATGQQTDVHYVSNVKFTFRP